MSGDQESVRRVVRQIDVLSRIFIIFLLCDLVRLCVKIKERLQALIIPNYSVYIQQYHSYKCHNYTAISSRKYSTTFCFRSTGTWYKAKSNERTTPVHSKLPRPFHHIDADIVQERTPPYQHIS